MCLLSKKGKERLILKMIHNYIVKERGGVDLKERRKRKGRLKGRKIKGCVCCQKKEQKDLKEQEIIAEIL